MPELLNSTVGFFFCSTIPLYPRSISNSLQIIYLYLNTEQLLLADLSIIRLGAPTCHASFPCIKREFIIKRHQNTWEYIAITILRILMWFLNTAQFDDDEIWQWLRVETWGKLHFFFLLMYSKYNVCNTRHLQFVPHIHDSVYLSVLVPSQ